MGRPKKVKKVKSPKKKSKTTEEIKQGEPVAIIAECKEACEAPTFPVIKMHANATRQDEITRKVELVMGFKPQIQREANGMFTVLIGYDYQSGIFTEGKTAIEATLNMFDFLTQR